MHIKSTLLIILCVTFTILANAQPLPCGSDPAMTSFCDEACIICDIDGFQGINNSNVVGQAPPGFCTNTVHHMQWIGFIAGSTNLTISVDCGNCIQGGGLEVGIYYSLDCENFTLVSNCNNGIAENSSGTFTNTVPLTIGQYYYFVMDGDMDGICNYTIHVVSGSTLASPLQNSGTFVGDNTPCLNSTVEYDAAPPESGTIFKWKLDGVLVGQDTAVTLNWTTPGTYNLCFTAANICDNAPPICQTITVEPTQTTIISATTCENECYAYGDTLLCNPGVHNFNFTNANGCDSLVKINLSVLPSQTTNLDLMICDGDSIFIGGQPFFDTGQFSKILSAQNGCDSIINLDLLAIICEIQGNLTTIPVSCNGAPTGALQFSILDGTPPFNYTWDGISNNLSGNGNISALNETQFIDNLSVGTYFITVTDNFGNDVILFGDVIQPDPLLATATLSNYNGYNVSCYGGEDGSINLSTSGGTPPYSYSWQNAISNTNIASNLSTDSYLFTVTDSNGCIYESSQILNEPDSLSLSTEFINQTCEGLNSGIINIMATNGGVMPYLYKLDDNNFDTLKNFIQLIPGTYEVFVQDANGCEQYISNTLTAPVIPEIEIYGDVTVNLSESIHLQLFQNTVLDTFIWMPPVGLSCTNCPNPIATPYENITYTLQVVAPGGCTDTDSISIEVIKRRRVYVPNMFSPNFDGVNDKFTVYGGGEVLKIKSLQVFSRWGELVYKGTDLLPNIEGWDGQFNGKDVNPDVFTWFTEVEFIDGVTEFYEGDVSISK